MNCALLIYYDSIMLLQWAVLEENFLEYKQSWLWFGLGLRYLILPCLSIHRARQTHLANLHLTIHCLNSSWHHLKVFNVITTFINLFLWFGPKEFFDKIRFSKNGSKLKCPCLQEKKSNMNSSLQLERKSCSPCCNC